MTDPKACAGRSFLALRECDHTNESTIVLARMLCDVTGIGAFGLAADRLAGVSDVGGHPETNDTAALQEIERLIAQGVPDHIAITRVARRVAKTDLELETVCHRYRRKRRKQKRTI